MGKWSVWPCRTKDMHRQIEEELCELESQDEAWMNIYYLGLKYMNK